MSVVTGQEQFLYVTVSVLVDLLSCPGGFWMGTAGFALGLPPTMSTWPPSSAQRIWLAWGFCVLTDCWHGDRTDVGKEGVVGWQHDDYTS